MYTLLQLRRDLARSVDALVMVVATGGSATTIVDTSLLDSGEFPDAGLVGATAYVVQTTDGLAPKGQGRYVTGYNSATGTLTVGQPFSAPIDAGDEIDLYTRYTLDELNTALMLSVRDWRFVTLVVLAPATFTYGISANGLHDRGQITGVWYRESAQSPYRPLHNYAIHQDAEALTLELRDALTGTIMVEYEARYDQLKSGAAFDDTRVVGGDLEHHIIVAQAHLFRRKMQAAAGPDRDWYASLYRETMERLQREVPVRPRASRAKMHTWHEVITRRYSPPFEP